MQRPIPVARLIEQVCDDGSDYDDGVDGYCSGTYDKPSGILTLKFTRADEDEPDEGDDWAPATYRFQLIHPSGGKGGPGLPAGSRVIVTAADAVIYPDCGFTELRGVVCDLQDQRGRLHFRVDPESEHWAGAYLYAETWEAEPT